MECRLAAFVFSIQLALGFPNTLMVGISVFVLSGIMMLDSLVGA